MAMTHVLNISIGFDLTKILAPKNIPGVKAYLNVESDKDLVLAIMQNKSTDIATLLKENGYEVVGANFEKVPEKETTKTDNDLPPVNETEQMKKPKEQPKRSQKDETLNKKAAKSNQKEEVDLAAKKKHLLDLVIATLKEIKKQRGEVNLIQFSAKTVDYALSPVELQHEANISEDVSVTVGDIDGNELAVINYISKDGELKSKNIEEED